jgi:MFS-type transporter involved in bile tolerance (Atg22 family)
MRLVIRLYWWMGLVGVATYSTLAIFVSLGWSFHQDPPTDAYIGFLTLCTVSIVAFASSIHVAHRLAAKPQGFLPWARMVGLILATWWFPILTVPGIICVRRATRHYAAYCNLISADNKMADPMA